MIADDDDPLTVFGKNIHIMADDEDGHALLMELAQEFHELFLIFAVLTARRFIEDDVLGMHGDGRGDGDPLFFAAIEIGRIRFGKVGQLRRFQSFVYSRLYLASLMPSCLGP